MTRKQHSHRQVCEDMPVLPTGVHSYTPESHKLTALKGALGALTDSH